MSEQLVVTYPSSDTSVKGVNRAYYFPYLNLLALKTTIPYFATINSATFNYSYKYSTATSETISHYVTYYSNFSTSTGDFNCGTTESTSHSAETYYTNSFTATDGRLFGNKTVRSGNQILQVRLRSRKAYSTTTYFYAHLNTITYDYTPFQYNIQLFSQEEGQSASSFDPLNYSRSDFQGSLINNDSQIKFYINPQLFGTGTIIYEITDGTNSYYLDSNNEVVIPVSSDLNITFKYREIQYTVNRHVFDINGVETIYPLVVNYSDNFTLMDNITEEIGTSINNTFINYTPSATFESNIPGFEYPDANSIQLNTRQYIKFSNDTYIVKITIKNFYPSKLKFYFNSYYSTYSISLFNSSFQQKKSLIKKDSSFSDEKFSEIQNNVISIPAGKNIYYLMITGTNNGSNNMYYQLGWQVDCVNDIQYFESRISKKLFGWYNDPQNVTDWYLTGVSTLNNGISPAHSLTRTWSKITAIDGGIVNLYAYYIPAVCYINYVWLDNYGPEDEYKLENYTIRYGGNHTIPNIPTYTGHYTVEHGGTDEWYKFADNDITTTEIINQDSILTNITQDYVFFGRKSPLTRMVNVSSNDNDFGIIHYTPIQQTYNENDIITLWAQPTNLAYFDKWINNNTLINDWSYNNYIIPIGGNDLNIIGQFRSNQVYTKGGSSS